METIISTIVIVACTYFFTRRKVKPTEQGAAGSTQPEASANIQQEEKQEEPPHTKDLCIELLKQLNCEVSVEEEDENRLYFQYQGEHFIIDATNESFFIDIWDSRWYIVPLDDLEQMSNVRHYQQLVWNNYFLYHRRRRTEICSPFQTPVHSDQGNPSCERIPNGAIE